MKKFAFLVAAIAATLVTSPVLATSGGQLSSGPNMYQVKNVTKGGSYASSASAACGETVKYSFELSNSEYGKLSNVTVKAGLTGPATATATNSADKTTSVSASVNVTVTGGTLKYVNGSTVLLNVNGSTIRTLADGVTAGGVNAGDLNGSTREFVQWQAKVECETPPKNITVCELATKKVITIREDQFDAKKHSKDLNKCAEVPTPGKVQVCELATKQIVTIDDNKFDTSKYSKDLNDCKVEEVLGAEAPTVIAATGPTGAIAAMFGLSGLAAAAVYFLQRRNILG